jgi:THAP4-like, heme-binding beta-barrel domain
MMSFVAGAILTLLTMPPTGGRQPAQQVDQWARVRFLLGSWEGTQAGRPGTGTVRRRYRLVLRDQFIEVRNTSTYPPQEKNPKGEVHDDIGYLSYDRARKRLVLRQFHVEGFVNQYVEEPESSAGKLVFVSEAIENIPPRWRARETYIVHGSDEFEEIFELAEGDKPFELYSRARLKRVPQRP